MITADPQMLKGVLPMLLLVLLHQQQDYGYALVLRLRAAGLTQAGEGSVYPALSRLEAHGALASHLQASSGGPARKYYAPTPAGTAELTRAHTAWQGLVRTVTSVTAGTAVADTTDLTDQGDPVGQVDQGLLTDPAPTPEQSSAQSSAQPSTQPAAPAAARPAHDHHKTRS